ncbi:RNA polymerase I-associated factor PAF67-domain-containing protein [Hyaloraphidium curvatum]|nr:RNA polymerase I-associated factor PAF67-domain-containing protein [Hyaloraphidium curvatum]
MAALADADVAAEEYFEEQLAEAAGGLEIPAFRDDGDEDDLGDYVPGNEPVLEVSIPDPVRNFLLQFARHIAERNVYDLHYFYANSFNKLTEKFYPKSPWPEPEAVAAVVGDDVVFIILYRELYYRHIYAKMQPSIDERFASYYNYCDLFNYILNSDEPVELELPNEWLWDIIDEFIYQFQAFCQYRSKVKAKNDAELTLLKERPDVWNVHNVLNVLYSLVQKAKINEQLVIARTGGDMNEVADEFGIRTLYKMLGYFSIIGLLRVHCLLGDYTLALKTMENVELNKKGLFSRVTACHVTTYYYVGFSYLMMRRYPDAIKAFSHILLFVSRTKQYHTRSYQFEVINKKSDQMYALLAMCVALCPTKLDESIQSTLRDKHSDHLAKMQRSSGDESIQTFEELFMYACPKFISPVPPNYEVSVNVQQEPARHQLKMFLQEVRSQMFVPTIRSYLKLYTTLDVNKLSEFLEDTDVDGCRNQLLLYKHKTRQRRWESGSVLDGEYAPTIQDLDFFLRKDMIHVAEQKVGRRMADWFIRNINRTL